MHAYFVHCGLGDTMTQTDIDTGQVIVLVGFKLEYEGWDRDSQ